GGDQTTRANIINNYYKPGPITPDAPIARRIIKPDSRRGKNIPLEFGKFYVAGNVIEGDAKVTADNWAGGVQIAEGGSPDDPTLATTQAAEALLPTVRVNEPFPMAA